MRRGVTAVVATVLGTGLMVGAKLGHAANTEEIAAPAVDAAAADDPQVEPSGSAPAAPPSAGSSPAGSAAPKPSGPRPSAAPSRPAASPSSRPAAGKYKDGTYTGPAVRERYGSITVTITVSGGKITNAAGSCSCSGQSLSISENAFGKLNQRVLTAQSATVASVSGATYTSSAYVQSLAAAIDRAQA